MILAGCSHCPASVRVIDGFGFCRTQLIGIGGVRLQPDTVNRQRWGPALAGPSPTRTRSSVNQLARAAADRRMPDATADRPPQASVRETAGAPHPPPRKGARAWAGR